MRSLALGHLAETREDDWKAMKALLDEALLNAGEHHRVRSQIESRLAGMHSNLGDGDAMLAYATAAVESAERAGDPGLLSHALAIHATGAFFNGGVIEREMLERAIELEDSAPSSTFYSPSGSLAQILFWSDDYGPGRLALERAVQQARARGEAYDIGALEFELGILEWHAGNRAVAERHRAAAEDAMSEQGEQASDEWLAWGESLFAAGRGELEAARPLARDAIAMCEGSANTLIAALPTQVLAWVELWTDHPAVAHDLLRPVREEFLSRGCWFMGSLMLPLWSCDIEALIARGGLDDAQLVLDDLLARARASDNPNARAIAERCRGLLLAARGDVPAAIETLEAALAEHALRPLDPEIARTLLELGALQRRAKQKTAAKDSLERALAMFEHMGAGMWAARARDELGRVGLRRAAASEGLTPAQTRVAELVLAGKSNREIAGTLYMSQRSVEAHLTKIYREFGVRSRAQLVAAMSAAQATAETDSDATTDATALLQ